MKSQKEKALSYRSYAKIARFELLFNKSLRFIGRVYLRSITENVGMNSRGVIKLSKFRSVSIIAETVNLLPDIEVLHLSCEEIQLQSYKKEVEELLFTHKKRLLKSSCKVQRVFNVENFTKAIIQYHKVISQVKHNSEFKNIYDLISIPCFLWLAYSKIRKDIVVEPVNIPVKSMTFAGLLKIAQELHSEKYSPSPVKRVYIPKVSGGKKFSGILSTKDKIVQQSLLMILSPIFETKFYDFSHGFRPGKSCHSALKSISRKGNGTIWFIELTLVQSFERIHHDLLIDEIRIEIKDQQVVDLIYKMFNVGYVNIHQLIDSKLEQNLGTCQVSILSPLFANIFLHRLDIWVKEVLLPKFNAPKVDKIRSDPSIVVHNHVGSS